MKTSFLIWIAAVCLKIVLVNSEEQCDIYGRLVEKPGRQCICDQRGVVRCKPRFGGRFLVCVLDLSQLGSNIEKLFDKISAQKRMYRNFVMGSSKKEKEEKIDKHFDPPDFTMTSRPSIEGGIGTGNVDFGKGEDAAGGGVAAGGDAAGGDAANGDAAKGDAAGGGAAGAAPAGGGVTAGGDAAGGDAAGGDGAGGDVNKSGGDENAEERFRRMKHPQRKPVSKVLRHSRQTKTSRNATKTGPKNARKPRRTNEAAKLLKLVAKNAFARMGTNKKTPKPQFANATQKSRKTKYAKTKTWRTKPKPIASQQKRPKT